MKQPISYAFRCNRRGSRLFCNEEGATSILVIFMMLVLVTLGTFSIASANVNLKFAQKNVDTNTTFYKLDAAGERYLYAVDAALAQVRAAAHTDETDDAALDQIYLRLARDACAALKDQYPTSTVTPQYENEQLTAIHVAVTLQSEINENTALSIELAVRGVPAAASAERFEVRLWQQTQTPFEYPSGLELWDGSLGGR